MTTVIEVVAPLDVAAATRLDKRIRLMASTVRENLAKIAELVDEAKAGQVHVALGFASWTAYLSDALGGQLELGTDDRRAVVELLAGEGMSQRGIAAAVGVSQKTVDRDLDQVSHRDSPDPVVTGLDGKTYPKKPSSKKKPVPQPATGALGHEEAMRAAAQIAELSAWGKACDGLLAALSFAASSRPPENTERYPSVETFAERYSALGSRMSEWTPVHSATVVDSTTVEHRPTGDELLAQSDALDRLSREIVKDLFNDLVTTVAQIEEEPDDGDTHTLWSPDVTITVTSRIDYEDLRPWTLSLYRHTADCDCHVWWNTADNSKFGDPLGRFSKWLSDPESCPDFDVFGATFSYLDPLYLITNIATWIAEEFGGDSIEIARVLLHEHGIWDYRVTESIKNNAAAGGDLGE